MAIEEEQENNKTMVFFPEIIIRHIQSFMSQHEAARTALVSKLWRDAWFARPELRFTLSPSTNIDKFAKFANKTIRRYRDSDLKLESLTLSIQADCVPKRLKRVARDIIHDAVELGVTRLVLNGVWIAKRGPYGCVTSSNIEELTLSKCSIAPIYRFDLRKLCSLSLEGLKLHRKFFTDFSSLKFPCLKRLSLVNCCITASCLELESCSIIASINRFNLRKVLCSLSLDGLKLHNKFFTDFSSKFPCLKRLSLVHCCIPASCVQVESSMIEEIVYETGIYQTGIDDFETGSRMLLIKANGVYETGWYEIEKRILVMQFNVPNIRRFKYTGPVFPLGYVSVETRPSREWEFDASIIQRVGCEHESTWLLHSNLKRFRGARISLSQRIIEFWSHGHGEAAAKRTLMVRNIRGTVFDETETKQPLPEPLALQSLSTNIDEECRQCSRLFSRLFVVQKVSGDSY